MWYVEKHLETIGIFLLGVLSLSIYHFDLQARSMVKLRHRALLRIIKVRRASAYRSRVLIQTNDDRVHLQNWPCLPSRFIQFICLFLFEFPMQKLTLQVFCLRLQRPRIALDFYGTERNQDSFFFRNWLKVRCKYIFTERELFSFRENYIGKQCSLRESS